MLLDKTCCQGKIGKIIVLGISLSALKKLYTVLNKFAMKGFDTCSIFLFTIVMIISNNCQ